MPLVNLGDDVFRFESSLSTRDIEAIPEWKTEDYANETMLFSADWRFARDNGGPMTQIAMGALLRDVSFVQALKARLDLNPVIDTRVHMLMPGMIPAIGGWHCDALPRPGGDYGDQPNPRLYDPGVEHYTLTMSQGETSRTTFLTEPVEVFLPPGERAWTKLHEAILAKNPGTMQVPHGQIARFDQGTPHKASITTTAGWRFFFRASLLNSTPQNQIRRQVQVYIPHEGHGW